MSIVYVFFLKDRFGLRARMQSTLVDRQKIQKSLKSKFSNFIDGEYHFFRILRQPPSDALEFEQEDGTLVGSLVLKDFNRSFLGEDIHSYELKFKEGAYQVKYRWGISVKNSWGVLLTEIKLMWPRTQTNFQLGAEIYTYHKYFWGEAAIIQGGKLLMFSRPSGLQSKRLLLVKNGMSNEFYVVALALSAP
jgi:hypothetical protein